MKSFFVGLVMVLFFAGDVLSAVKVVDKTTVTDKTLADKTLATVNGEPIFISEFDQIFEVAKKSKSIPASSLKSELRDPILDQLSLDQLRDSILDQQIMNVVLKQEATKQKIMAPKREISDRINEIKKGYKHKSEFDAILKEGNMTLSDLEKNIADQIIVEKFAQRLKNDMYSKTKKPSEIEAKSFYDEIVTKMKGGKTNITGEEEVLAEFIAKLLIKKYEEHVRLIGIFISCPKGASKEKTAEALDKIAAVKKELKNKKPEEFDDVVVHFEDVASKSRNGDIRPFAGTYVEEDLSSVMRKIVFSKNVGDYTKEPIREDDGYYFLRVQEKTAKINITFAKVKDSIVEKLYEARVNKKWKESVDELKSKANIKINKTW
ncbi:foldase protein PrsA [Endomicrobiia bacterium]|nr:foldase protein PrsA [Endomicrobiia bacterium]GHT74677.1 foldase protein PrsA [Endomicrobiia bacterium]